MFVLLLLHLPVKDPVDQSVATSASKIIIYWSVNAVCRHCPIFPHWLQFFVAHLWIFCFMCTRLVPLSNVHTNVFPLGSKQRQKQALCCGSLCWFFSQSTLTFYLQIITDYSLLLLLKFQTVFSSIFFSTVVAMYLDIIYAHEGPP